MTEQNKNLKRETATLCALTAVLMIILIALVIGGSIRLFYQAVNSPEFYSLYAGNFLIQ